MSEGNKGAGSSPASIQAKALTAYEEMEKKIEQLPGNDIPGTMYSAFAYLYSKYQLAMCILTVGAEGGACWMAAAKYFGGTAKFLQNFSLQRQVLLMQLQNLKPTITSVHPGQTDFAGAQSRWVRTQTQLCRVIQRQCL